RRHTRSKRDWSSDVCSSDLRSSIDDSVASFMMSIVRIGSKVIVIMMAVTTLGIETSSILAVLASAGVAVGLALQGSLSNICSGRSEERRVGKGWSSWWLVYD